MPSELPLVILLPHPDDEFAILPYLADEFLAGRELHLIWITDGAFGGNDPAIRREESLAALDRCAITPTSALFVGMADGLPDGTLHLHMGRAFEALRAAVEHLDTPFELWIPAWEGGHQDHDAAHALGRTLARSFGGIVIEYPLYNGENLAGPLFRTLTPLKRKSTLRERQFDSSDLQLMLRACACYKSQWRSFAGLLPLTIYHFAMGRPLSLAAVDLHTPMSKPHSGRLLYERRTSLRWVDVARSFEAFW